MMTGRRDLNERERCDEIEITHEMIEAGYLALCDSGVNEFPMEADKLVVREIYAAMRRLERKKEGPRHAAEMRW